MACWNRDDIIDAYHVFSRVFEKHELEDRTTNICCKDKSSMRGRMKVWVFGKPKYLNANAKRIYMCLVMEYVFGDSKLNRDR